MNKNIQTINIISGLSNLILVFYYISIWILNDFEMTGGFFAYMWLMLIIATLGINSRLMFEGICYKEDRRRLVITLFFSVIIMIVIIYGLIMLNLLKIDHKEKNIYDEKKFILKQKEI